MEPRQQYLVIWSPRLIFLEINKTNCQKKQRTIIILDIFILGFCCSKCRIIIKKRRKKVVGPFKIKYLSLCNNIKRKEKKKVLAFLIVSEEQELGYKLVWVSYCLGVFVWVLKEEKKFCLFVECNPVTIKLCLWLSGKGWDFIM